MVKYNALCFIGSVYLKLSHSWSLGSLLAIDLISNSLLLRTKLIPIQEGLLSLTFPSTYSP